ncbi:unnamed protein product, partial [Brachionus calyciflorus]
MNSARTNDESLKNLLKSFKNTSINPSAEIDRSKQRLDSNCSVSASTSKCTISKSDKVKCEKKSIQNMIKTHPLLIDLNNSKQKYKLESEESDFGLKKIDTGDSEDDNDYDNENNLCFQSLSLPKDDQKQCPNYNQNNNENCFKYKYEDDDDDDEFDYRKMIMKSTNKKCKPKQEPCSKPIRKQSPVKDCADNSENVKKKMHRANRIFYNGYLNKQDATKCYQTLPEYQTHASELLHFLKSLWSEKKMCDLSIEVANRKYPAHKIGLAMFSKKYREEFQKKANQSIYTISLKYSTVYSVEAILNYIYTAKIDINPSNVEEILCCAKELGIDELIQMANDYLSSLSIGDVLDYMGNIINKEGSELMFYELYVYFMTHLDKISRTPEFLKSSICVVNALLSDSHLSVNKELEVFEACLRWLEFDKQNRLCKLTELLRNVRFTLISPDDLVSKVESTVNMNDSCIFKQIYSAYKYHALNMSKLTNFMKREENRNECLKGASV